MDAGTDSVVDSEGGGSTTGGDGSLEDVGAGVGVGVGASACSGVVTDAGDSTGVVISLTQPRVPNSNEMPIAITRNNLAILPTTVILLLNTLTCVNHIKQILRYH